MNAVRIEARIRNNRLWHVIHDVSSSVADFCRRYDFSRHSIDGLLNLTDSPRGVHGDWRPVCVRLSEHSGLSLDELFPAKLYELERTHAVAEVDDHLLSAKAAARLLMAESPSIDEQIDRKEMLAALEAAVGSLTEVQATVIRLRYGLDGGDPLTLEQVGERIELTRERVRQIEAKALRMLRHPSRTEALRAHWGGESR